MGDGGLLDTEQAEVHRTLCRHVAIRTGLAEIPVSLKKTEQSVLADVHPVLADVHPVLPEHLRELANQARAVGRGDRVGKPSFRLQHLDLCVLGLKLLVLALDGLLRDEHGPGHDVLIRIRLACGDITAGPADLRQHLVSHPTLELLRLRLPRAHDELVQARLGDDVDRLIASIF